MSEENGNINANILNEELQKSTNKEILNNSKFYILSSQTNFTIISNLKTFKNPLSIEKYSLNFNSTKLINSIKLSDRLSGSREKKNKKGFVQINNASIFIGGRQNLKGMRIHLSKYSKYNNTAHREITSFKNKSVDKANARLNENKNKTIEKVNIDLFEKNEKEEKEEKAEKDEKEEKAKKDEKDENNKKNNVFDALNFINMRWKNNQNIIKNSLSLISKKESIPEQIIINKKNYIQGLLNNIKINSNQNKNNKNQDKIILIKQEKNNINKNYNYEIISPNTKEELEMSINTFINDNKENQNNNSEYMTSQSSSPNNGKKKSKFVNQQEIQFKKAKENINNKQNQKEEFIPIFILNNKDIIELYEIIEKKPNKKQKINYSIDNNISLNYIGTNKNEKLRGKNQRNLDDINFDIFPVKVDKFEFINILPNEIRTNYNIDVSNIALNQSDIMKQVKGGENEFDYLLNKNKEMEDFSQNTPISLLQEKYFIYAVSKWIKYSIPNPQSRLYVKYNYKTGHPMFDPINLMMTNFTLWIERIETKRSDNKKGIVSISSSVNYNNSFKNSKISTGKNSTNKKKGYVNIYSNNNINDNNQINKRKNNSKSKVYK